MNYNFFVLIALLLLSGVSVAAQSSVADTVDCDALQTYIVSNGNRELVFHPSEAAPYQFDVAANGRLLVYSVSSDGRYLAYNAEDAIRLYDSQTETTVPLLDGALANLLNWSVDNILYIEIRDAPDDFLYIYDMATDNLTEVVRVQSPQSLLRPFGWSATGRYRPYEIKLNEEVSELYLYDTLAAESILIREENSLAERGSVTFDWSPDDRYAVIRLRGRSYFLLDSDTLELTELDLPISTLGRRTTWLPDEQRFVYLADDSSVSSYNVETGESTSIYDTDSDPSYSTLEIHEDYLSVNSRQSDGDFVTQFITLDGDILETPPEGARIVLSFPGDYLAYTTDEPESESFTVTVESIQTGETVQVSDTLYHLFFWADSNTLVLYRTPPGEGGAFEDTDIYNADTGELCVFPPDVPVIGIYLSQTDDASDNP